MLMADALLLAAAAAGRWDEINHRAVVVVARLSMVYWLLEGRDYDCRHDHKAPKMVGL